MQTSTINYSNLLNIFIYDICNVIAEKFKYPKFDLKSFIIVLIISYLINLEAIAALFI